MTNARTRLTVAIATAGMSAIASAQSPDLLSAFEMGGRALGMGGALYSNASDASASYWNPAGLGHIQQTQVELNFRNRPNTDTTLTGDFDDPDRATESTFGSSSITFGGIAVPFRGGTIGVSYALGGYLREIETGMSLSDPGGGPTTKDVTNFLKVVNEFVTVGWGTKRGSGLNFGAGIVFARQFIANDTFERINDGMGNIIIVDPPAVDETGTGLGGIVGVQFTPARNPNVSFGFSYRSKINMSGLDQNELFSDEIPARLQGGIVWRVDGLRGGRDYLIGGVDASYFLEANSGKFLERDNQISAGFGFEYNWAQSFGYLPIRLGYRTTESGGVNFDARDSFTFGLGYRPKSGDYWLDLNVATTSGQSNPDLAVSMSFMLGKK